MKKTKNFVDYHQVKCVCGSVHNSTEMNYWMPFWDEYCSCGGRWVYSGSCRSLMVRDEWDCDCGGSGGVYVLGADGRLHSMCWGCELAMMEGRW